MAKQQVIGNLKLRIPAGRQQLVLQLVRHLVSGV